MPVFYASFLTSIVLTPVMRGLAHRHGVVDDPDNKRKVHSQPIAYLGGVSIFLGWLAGVTVSVFLQTHNSETTVQIPPGILAGAFCAVFFGLMDDVYSLSPKMKLLGQLLAALALLAPSLFPMWAGTDFLLGRHVNPGAPSGPAWMILEPLARYGYLPPVQELFTMDLVRYGAPLFSVILTIVLIISTSNATNLLDGLDGLCSGVTGVMSVGYLILAAYLAHSAVGTNGGGPLDPARITVALALLGAVLGFLPYNFNPASIFMGDTGSMFLGFMCGTMILLFGQNGTVRWFLSAIIMFGLPMMDTLLAIVRRKLNGKPIFSPDSNHFHHFLIKRGLSVKRAVMLSYGVAAIFVSFALIIVIMPTPMALGIYLVLFGWIIVAAFKIGMIFQQPVAANTSLNISVIKPTNGATNGKADGGGAGTRETGRNVGEEAK
jgi:UDP-GlcNAc:undecaprenyl-phosphate/decaprenyl-phosphate GlcNAc-1-phosphate transferase